MMFRAISLAVLLGMSVGFTGVMADASFSSVEAGHKKQRPLYVKVKPRSYLDAGKVAPVGSLSQYAVSNRYNTPMSHGIGNGFGSYLLPDPIGGGRNPFGAY
jgi:hypothetical protein